MQLQVKDLGDKVLTLDGIKPTSTVRDIKNKIWSLTALSIDNQNLVFNGQSLENTSIVQSIGITGGTVLSLTTDLRDYGGGGNDDDEPSESDSDSEVSQADDHQIFNEIPNEPLYNEMIQIIEKRKDNTVDAIRLKVKKLDKELALVNGCPEADALEQQAEQYRDQASKVREEAKVFAKAQNFKEAKVKRKEASKIEDKADDIQDGSFINEDMWGAKLCRRISFAPCC